MSKKKKSKRLRKEARLRALFYIKACLPVLTVLLVIIAMMIPSFRYTVAGAGTYETSEMNILVNAWTVSRTTLFGTTGAEEMDVSFARACFGTILGAGVLFIVSAGMSIWSAIGGVLYLLISKGKGNARALYLTFFNRPLLLFYQILMIPLLLFPYLLAWFYETLQFRPTILHLIFADPLTVFAALLLLWLILTVALRKKERRMGMDPFFDPRSTEDEEEDEEEEEDAPSFETEEEQRTYEMKTEAREEQLERIRQMLSRKNNDNDND